MSEIGANRLKGLFQQHPALLISALYVAASFIGMFYSWAYLRQFGINVFYYAQLSDFLLASLKEPFTWALVILATAMIQLDNASSRRFERKGKSKWFGWYGTARYRLANNIGAVFLVLVFLFAYATLQVRDTKDGNGKLVEVSFDEQGDAKLATLLGTTGQFVFLYDQHTERVDVHPIEGIHAISFQAD